MCKGDNRDDIRNLAKQNAVPCGTFSHQTRVSTGYNDNQIKNPNIQLLTLDVLGNDRCQEHWSIVFHEKGRK